MKRSLLALFLISVTTAAVYADEAVIDSKPAVATEPALEAATDNMINSPKETPAPKFVVLLPERVDTEWFWSFYADNTSQHIVQSAVEKSLINNGFDVIDLGSIQKLKQEGSIEDITSTENARQIGKDAGATYAVVGTATAVKASEGQAYGVNVYRSNAEITAKLIRVEDGKVIAVEDASAQKGGQAARAAGQEALKDAGAQIARKITALAKKTTAPPAP